MQSVAWIIAYIYIYKSDLSIFILIIRLSLQIYVPIERTSVVVCVCMFVAQCHFFSLSLFSPSSLSTMCYVHAMLALQKRKRAKNKIFVYV